MDLIQKKNTARFLISACAVVVVILASFIFLISKKENQLESDPIISENSIQNSEYLASTLKISNKTIQVDLADTPATREQGLSGRVALAPDHGMLFVFENSDKYGFWMNEMNFSIDIIWIDEAKRVVHIEKNVSPESFPKIFTPTEPAKYVLEVSAGFSDLNGLMVGDPVDF